MNVIRAAAVGDDITVKKWLDAPGVRHDHQAMQVLYEAASQGHDKICRLMLESEILLEEAVAVAFTAACRKNMSLAAAQLLVRYGKGISSNRLNEALLGACVSGHTHIVEWLISNVMKLSPANRIRCRFVAACACGDMVNIRQLATKLDSNKTGIMSLALNVACHNGRHNVVNWLTSHTPADVSCLNTIHAVEGDVTSLMVACDMSYHDITRQLLQCVTPHTINMMSGTIHDTALHFVISGETNANMMLHSACINGDIDIAENLLHLSDVDLQVSGGYTTLHFACIGGHIEIVRILLSAFAKTDVTSDARRTPAMMADSFGHTEVLPYLQCTLSDTPPDIPFLVSVCDDIHNNGTVSVPAFLSVDGVMTHNSDRPNRQAGRSVRIV